MRYNENRASIINKTNFKRAFTIVEVSILFVIFLIVAFLVAPLSLDDTVQVKNTARWKNVQSDFENIFYAVDTKRNESNFDIKKSFEEAIKSEITSDIKPYKITYLKGSFPSDNYKFDTFNKTYSKAVISYKWLENTSDGILGYIMYDVNGNVGPNKWGKDIFGFNIYNDRLEPFCKNDPVQIQKKDCSKTGTGLCCSSYYLIGGSLH